MTRDEALRYRALIETAASYVPDDVAVKSVELFQMWRPETGYDAGQRVNYQGDLYRCLYGHVSQSMWTPTDAPSLWAKVLVFDDHIAEWVQPDSTNPYKAGDKVTYAGNTWVSNIDNNVWAPGVYGWSMI